MGSISPYVGQQEVTRKVHLSPPDAVSRARSATANQKQTVTWAQRIGGWTEYTQMTIETS
jgi:hypothetical protein